MKNNKIIIPKL